MYFYKISSFSAFYYVILMFFVKLSKQLLTLKIIFLNMVLNAFVVGGFHLEALQRVLRLGNNDIALRHGISPFQIIGRYRGRQRDISPIPCRDTVSGETVRPLCSPLSADACDTCVFSHAAPRCRFVKHITVPCGCTCFVRCNHIVRADMRNIDRKFCHHTFVAVRSLRHASDHELPASDKQRNASVARQLCISSLSLENRMKSMFFGIASNASDNRGI